MREWAFNYNISKGGASASIKNKIGSYNLLKPNYSSFKLAGAQVIVTNAATLQLLLIVCDLLVNIFNLLWHVGTAALWVVDFIIGFSKGVEPRGWCILVSFLLRKPYFRERNTGSANLASLKK